jgi:glucuronosyltransferase
MSYYTFRDTGHLFSLAKHHANADVIFTDYPESIPWTLPKTLEYFETGTQCKAGKSLPANIESFVTDENSKGTIIIALGTYGDFDLAPAHITQAFIDAFTKMKDYRFVWNYKGGMKRVLPSNVLAMGYLPQNDLLFHNKTKLFISHGGLKRFVVNVINVSNNNCYFSV